MSEEEREVGVSKLYMWDLTDGYDTQDQKEIFLRKLQLSPFYQPNLLYCGFDARDIAKIGNTKGKNIIFVGDGSSFLESSNNPFEFALEYDNPAIAVYDPTKLEPVDEEHEEAEGYRVKDPSALITVIRLKVE